MSERFVVIMAGGRGERFWPQSREATPKHLLPIVGDKVYGGKGGVLFGRQALHAASIEFLPTTPSDGPGASTFSRLRVEAPLAADMMELLARLRRAASAKDTGAGGKVG